MAKNLALSLEVFHIEELEILEPVIPFGTDINIGVPIPPIERLKIMNDTNFEDMVSEWAHGFLKEKYTSVYRLGGSGDKGRDVCAKYANGKIDIYQCKHYAKPLSPSEYIIEIGKLVYYTFITDGYDCPENYYIVASNGLGPTLVDLVEKPVKMRNYLISEWDNKCRKQITQKKELQLVGDFLKHVEDFNFSIIKYLSPEDLINNYMETPYFKFRFGGGIKKRPEVQIPQVSKKESNMPYVQELVSVYSDTSGCCWPNFEDFIKDDSKFSKHFMRQRKSFYTADSLRRFLRDEYIQEKVFDTFQQEIYDAVVDKFDDNYINKFERMNSVLESARNISIKMSEIPDILPTDKTGTCHIMVEKGELSWND